jgi:hypothetical protein
LLDRIDIQIEVPAVPYRELRAEEVAESSADMLGRVERARETQHARGLVNSRMPARLIRKQCALDEAGLRRSAEMTRVCFPRMTQGSGSGGNIIVWPIAIGMVLSSDWLLPRCGRAMPLVCSCRSAS